MKTLLILFIVTSLSIYTVALCPYACQCVDDTVCEYYCAGFQCQSPIPKGETCSGHSSHPRECGSISYCDRNSRTCQYQKSIGDWCAYDYSCMSEYCDASTNTCRFQNTIRWKIFILVPCLIVFLFFTLFIMVIVMRRRRQQAFTGYQNRCVVLPSGTPCSYQNSCMVGEMPPPPYPGLICATSSKSYQG